MENKEKKITVCFVVPYEFSYAGGVQAHTLHLGRALEKEGVGVFYLSPTQPEKWVPENHIRLGWSLRVPSPNGSSSNISLAVVGRPELRELVECYQIDLFHFQELMSPFLSYQVLQLSPVKNVVTAHAGWDKKRDKKNNSILKSEGWARIGKSLREKINLGIAVSPVAARCGSLYLPSRVEIVPNAVDISMFRRKLSPPPRWNPKCLNMVFVGRLDTRKGVRFLLRAMAEIPPDLRGKITLHLIGAGSRRGYLEMLTGYLGLEDQVRFWGRVSDEQKIAFLQHSDIFVSPAYRGESFGIVLVEAMAAGLPVIAGNNDGYRSLLADYPWPKALVNVKHSQEFAGAIKELIEKPALRNELSAWGKKFVEQFDAKKVARQHLRLYRELLKN